SAIVDAVPATNNLLLSASDPPGESDPRAKVVRVRIEFSCLGHQRIGLLDCRHGLQFVANAQIQGEVGADLDIVLDVKIMVRSREKSAAAAVDGVSGLIEERV